MRGYLYYRHVLLKVQMLPEPKMQLCFARHAYLKGVVPAHAQKGKSGCLVAVDLIMFLLADMEILNG